MSTTVNTEFIERYQLEYQNNPRSKVFAPLAEAYRKIGLVDEAYRICALGVKLHPDFVSGLVAFAKILIDRKNFPEALICLERAAQLSPDNLLAHTLLGETLLSLRRPKDALKAFKMVLFLNPSDKKALETVQKWEFLTADEYEEELFAMRPVFKGKQEASGSALDSESVSNSAAAADADGTARAETEAIPVEATKPRRSSPLANLKREVERAISLADAFTVRHDVDAAIDVLEKAKEELGSIPDIVNRLNLLTRRARTEVEAAELDDASDEKAPEKQHLLTNLLQRINERRGDL